VKNCDKCGQVLPEATVFEISFLRDNLDFDASWEYFNVGQRITELAAEEYPSGFPDGTELTVIATDTDSIVDSYGDESATAYVVFSVSLNGKSKNYKVEGTNSSYDGWDWDRWTLSEVAEKPRTITIWESV
jgi:hypothetical protein